MTCEKDTAYHKVTIKGQDGVPVVTIFKTAKDVGAFPPLTAIVETAQDVPPLPFCRGWQNHEELENWYYDVSSCEFTYFRSPPLF